MKRIALLCLISIGFITFLSFVSASNAQVPMDQRHPDAGVWLAYLKFPLSQYPNIADIKGARIYANWKDMYQLNASGNPILDASGNPTYDWTNIDLNLDRIVKDGGKKAFMSFGSGYCPDNDWPKFLRDRIPYKIIPDPEKGCNTLQFWDPLYKQYYSHFMSALAKHIAAYDKEVYPDRTDIVIVRAMPMAVTMENLPDEDVAGNGTYDCDKFAPAPLTGRTCAGGGGGTSVPPGGNLTEAKRLEYHDWVAREYKRILEQEYAAVGLTPPAVASKNIAYHTAATTTQQNLARDGIWYWNTNSAAVPPGSWYELTLRVKTGITRGHNESGQHPTRTDLFVQSTYWEMLANLHAGEEFIGPYGVNSRLPTEQPLGPAGYTENFEGLRFANIYAGFEREPDRSPGAFIALRGWYPLTRFSTIQHTHLWTDYTFLMTHYRPQDSVMLFGTADTGGDHQNYSPHILRNLNQDPSDDYSLCLNTYPASECDYTQQIPTVNAGSEIVNGTTKTVWNFPVTNLGTVRSCGEDLFCTSGGTVTKTETMLWARRTDRAGGHNYMRFNLNDTFAGSLGNAGSRSARVRVVYLDRGTDRWQLLRDNDVLVGTITKTNTDIWKEAFFDITSASLNNLGTGETDIALYNNNDSDDIFHIVEITRTTQPAPPTPTQPASNTPTPPKPASPVITPLVSCLSAPSSTNVFSVTWTNNPGENPVNQVRFTSDATFTTTNFYKNNGLTGVTSTTGPIGFTHQVDGTSTSLSPSTPYNFQVYNGRYSDTVSFTIPRCSVPGDVDGDYAVTLQDLATLLSGFGRSGNRNQGDVSGDGIVNLNDLTLLLSNFGR